MPRATTATANDEAFRALMDDALAAGRAHRPALSRRPRLYRRAASPRCSATLAGLAFEPEVILASFHGVPKDYLVKGDPYHCQCVKTWRLLREALGWPQERFRMTFQSRFGPASGSSPIRTRPCEGLAESGVRRLAVMTPGLLGRLPRDARGARRREPGDLPAPRRRAISRYLPCLNDSAEGMRVIRHLVERELQGWL